MYRKVFLYVCLVLIVACSETQEPVSEREQATNSQEVKKEVNLDWLEGEWRDSTSFGGRIIFVESWKKSGENSLVGSKHQIANGAPSSPTELRLVETDGIFYYSYWEEENQITFVQDSVSEGFLSFVNTTDKFPTNLSYSLKDEVLTISFSGLANGVFRSASFVTKKEIKKN